MRIEYHRTLIADRVRNEAFRTALKSVIRKGESVVADIGAGTGLIAFMALELGAREVHLYESEAVLGVAREIARANGFKRCRFFAQHSTSVPDPPRADIVVSETLGNYAFEENILATLDDARTRFLKPGGVLIPSGVAQFVCPVIADRQWRELTVWDDAVKGLDMSPARLMSHNNAYVRLFPPSDLLDEGRQARAFDRADLTRPVRSARKGEAEWTVAEGVTIFGAAVWWEATLRPGLVLSTAPSAPRTHWEQLYFPVVEPIELARGDTLAISLRTRSSYEEGTNMAWTFTWRAASGAQKGRQALDLDKGFLP